MTSERLQYPPTEGVREAPFVLRDTSVDDPDKGWLLDGFGSVFNRLTVIDSWEGRFREQFAPGSMKRSFRETPPKVQFDHGRHPLIGSIPIAALRSISEEVDPLLAPEGGAHIVARIFDNWLMAPVRDAIVAKAIAGMSHRFSVVREAWSYADGKPIRDERALIAELERAANGGVAVEDLPIRTIKEARILEMGPVVWPAYQQTSVGVRSFDLERLRAGDPEQRRLLAETVFLADAAQDEEAQRDTADPVVVERPADSDDAQRSTAEKAVGEHPSNQRKARAIELRQARETMLSIYKKGSKR